MAIGSLALSVALIIAEGADPAGSAGAIAIAIAIATMGGDSGAAGGGGSNGPALSPGSRVTCLGRPRAPAQVASSHGRRPCTIRNQVPGHRIRLFLDDGTQP